ncbi:synaptonemal complex protein 3-like isoform X3 [Nannospalax galili]|uniref:synaptonemal complex protein 3-like isoform X3 n=1 Tax=Nannospalax galili TaxID=1026970 RepID=UPI00111BEE9D|nr:synaptonemal complex protein 3-like isoform X3 [Nannospalax galili]
MEDPGSAIHDFEGQDQNASEKGVTKEQSPVIDKHEVKSSAGILGDTGAEVQKILEKFGEDVHSILLSKRRSMEVFTKESLKDSTQKIEELWKTYQSKRQKVNSEFSEKFETVFEQWNLHKQELEEETKEVAKNIKRQQKISKLSKVGTKQGLALIRLLFEKFFMGLDNLEYKTFQLTVAESELKKEISVFEKKLTQDTVNCISDSIAKH